MHITHSKAPSSPLLVRFKSAHWKFPLLPIVNVGDSASQQCELRSQAPSFLTSAKLNPSTLRLIALSLYPLPFFTQKIQHSPLFVGWPPTKLDPLVSFHPTPVSCKCCEEIRSIRVHVAILLLLLILFLQHTQFHITFFYEQSNTSQKWTRMNEL